jgi:NTP pyrophosphatase (non-canonical NTP hydrolase)
MTSLHDIVLRTHSTLRDGPLGADRTKMLICAALGLIGEAAEVTEPVKKWYEQGRPLDRDKLVKEVFDVLYYCQLMLMSQESSMEECLAIGEAKLRTRYPDGFSAEASLARKDVTNG